MIYERSYCIKTQKFVERPYQTKIFHFKMTPKITIFHHFSHPYHTTHNTHITHTHITHTHITIPTPHHYNTTHPSIHIHHNIPPHTTPHPHNPPNVSNYNIHHITPSNMGILYHIITTHKVTMQYNNNHHNTVALTTF